MTTDEWYLSPARAAERMAVTREFVYRELRSERLKAIKVAGRWRIPTAALDSYVRRAHGDHRVTVLQ